MAVVIHDLAVGVPYRIRAVYDNSDGYHIATHSSWSYLKVLS